MSESFAQTTPWGKGIRGTLVSGGIAGVVTGKLAQGRSLTRSEPAQAIYARVYSALFILAAILCWSPSKLAAYFAPLAVTLGCIAAAQTLRPTLAFTAYSIFWVAMIAIRAFVDEGFVTGSALLSYLTTSMLAFILCAPSKGLADERLQGKLKGICCAIVVLEGLIGIAQAVVRFTITGTFDSSNGDYVRGTIDLLGASDSSFSNPMFAASMTYSMLFLLPDFLRTRRHLKTILIGSCAVVLASVMHLLYLFAFSMAVAWLIYRPKLTRRFQGVALLAVGLTAMGLAYYALRGNLTLISNYYEGMQEKRFARALMLERAVTSLPAAYPELLTIGLGPGQFCSRAALIGTGMYFGGPLAPRETPVLTPAIPPAASAFLMDLWIRAAQDRYGGSTSQPFFSWLSLYTEYGLIALVAVLTGTLILLFRIHRHGANGQRRYTAVALTAGVILFLLLGGQENYWEVPQALFPGLMLMKVLWEQVAQPRRGGRE